jgi:hypothetical protein
MAEVYGSAFDGVIYGDIERASQRLPDHNKSWQTTVQLPTTFLIAYSIQSELKSFL